MPKRRKTNPIIEMAGADLRVGERLLFRNTHWKFLPGEQWAVIGPNGSGKTLFAGALAGAVPVVNGDMIAPDGPVTHVSFEQHRSLAGEAPAAARWFSLEEDEAPLVEQLLSQDSVEGINPFEVVRRPSGAAKAFARQRKKVVKLLGIGSLLGQPLPSLSNGETRKVLLARALLQKPRLLILDDPFTGLDMEFRKFLKALLERLIRNGEVNLLLIATHADELPAGITHLLCMDRCRIVSQGRYLRRSLRKWLPRLPEIRRGSFPAMKKPAAPCELVRLRGATVRYGRRVILNHIDWTVWKGESWALVGPNGSGKSTLLSLIIGDNPQAYANDVRVMGRRRGEGESVWEWKRRIGFVSPELHLHFTENQSCLDSVLSGFDDSDACYRRPGARRRMIARHWLARLGLERFASAPFGSLSAGLQRMALLARALVKSPELLVLDEPCQGLDAAHRQRFIRILTGLLNHTTMIYVTHRRDEIPPGIRRVFRLGAGLKNR